MSGNRCSTIGRVRNSELIRQWKILQAIDGTPTGVSVRRLATRHDVHQRTIRRDIEALEQAGFPIYCDRANGTALYKFNTRPFRRLEKTGLTLTEMCALYMSRSTLEAFATLPFRDHLASAMEKIEGTLPEGVRAFLDKLPALLQAKAEPRKRRDERRLRDIMPRILDTALTRKRVRMTYHSFSSRRKKEYVIDPLRLAYAQGGVYLLAFVPTSTRARVRSPTSRSRTPWACTPATPRACRSSSTRRSRRTSPNASGTPRSVWRNARTAL